MKNIAVFAGSFDPITKGHYDIIERAAKLFDYLFVAVSNEAGGKKCAADGAARLRLVKKAVESIKNIRVELFDGFLVDYARKVGANILVRGLRNAADFEYEKSLGEVYKSQDPKLEIIYLTPPPSLCHVSSSVVREIAGLGGDVSGYAPDAIAGEIGKIYRK